MRGRNFTQEVLNHCYQRTQDHGVLFYSDFDHLLLLTVFCTMAVRHKVQVLALVQMPNHIHHGTVSRTRQQLSAFVRDTMSVFCKEYNRAYNRTGPLMEKPFGSAPKRGNKAVKTNLIYQANNPVERRLVLYAEEYRWNYLAYAVSDHPFSEKIILRHASMPLRRALKRIQYLHEKGRYLSIPLLKKLFIGLRDTREREQLIDYIVSTYLIIDFDAVTRLFGGYNQALLAIHSTTGSEYDIHESFFGKSDVCYQQFARVLLEQGELEEIHQIHTLPADEKLRLYRVLRRETEAPGRQIAAFLHLPVVGSC